MILYIGQNRRQKVFNKGVSICAGGIDILKFYKNFTDVLRTPPWRRDWHKSVANRVAST